MTHRKPNARGMYLRVLRIGQGYTQIDAAQAIDMSNDALSRMERGAYEPKRALEKIIRFLNGSFEDWYSLGDQPAEKGEELANLRLDLNKKMSAERRLLLSRRHLKDLEDN